MGVRKQISDASIVDKLGRYEYVHGTSNKFWSVFFVKGEYIVTWGRIGNSPQGTQSVDLYEALKRVNSKIAKGYQHVSMQVTNSKIEFPPLTVKPVDKNVIEKMLNLF
jgi:predicted DNA-binding WGR domain protein